MFAGDASSLQRDVTIRNNTGQPVRFTGIRQSCSCAGKTGLASLQLAPDQETTLHFDIDLRQRLGPQQFTCYVLTEGGDEWVYALQTTLHERARFDGPGGVHFGMVDPNSEVVRETQFYLHAENEAALPSVASFRTHAACLQAETGTGVVEELSDGTAVRRLVLKIRLHTVEAPGQQHGHVFAEFEHQGEKHQVQTVVTWNVRSHYSVTPAQVYFGKIDATVRAPLERQVLIRRLDGQPLRIREVKALTAGMRCMVEGSTDPTLGKLTLVLDPKSVKGHLWGEVTVETDHPQQPSLKVPVAAIAAQ